MHEVYGASAAGVMGRVERVFRGSALPYSRRWAVQAPSMPCRGCQHACPCCFPPSLECRRAQSQHRKHCPGGCVQSRKALHRVCDAVEHPQSSTSASDLRRALLRPSTTSPRRSSRACLAGRATACATTTTGGAEVAPTRWGWSRSHAARAQRLARAAAAISPAAAAPLTCPAAPLPLAVRIRDRGILPLQVAYRFVLRLDPLPAPSTHVAWPRHCATLFSSGLPQGRHRVQALLHAQRLPPL